MARLCAEGIKEWWAHNGGKFDGLFILEALKQLNWKVNAHITGGRIIMAKVHSPHGTFYLRDSFAVVPGKLEDIAKSFRLKQQKLFTKEDYTKVKEWSIEKLTAGCYVDCECVLELLDCIECLFKNNGGSLKGTFSSSAFTVVASHVSIIDMRPHVDVNEQCRDAFTGGRVEVLKHTPQYALTEFDINSSYPWAMTQQLPWRFHGRYIGREASKHYASGALGVVEVTVYTPDTYLPVLPWRHPRHKGIFFPVGEWRGRFDSEELRYAVKCGVRIKTLHTMHVFTSESPFSEFVRSFYSLKSNSPAGPEREFYKLCLNGATGKFSQKPEREEIVIYESQEEAIDEALRRKDKRLPQLRFLSSGDHRYVAIPSTRWAKQTHYALAGAITAQSRMRIHQYISAAHKPAYTDTDSIHAARESSGLARLESAALGMLKKELDDYSGIFAAPKLYACIANTQTPDKDGGLEYKKKFKSKGFPVSEETFSRIIEGTKGTNDQGEVTWNSSKIESPRMQLAKRQLKGDNTVRRPLTARSWKGRSTKRRPLMTADGDTTPWNVKELLADQHLSATSPLAKWLSKS